MDAADTLANLMINIAYNNSDFICSQCLDTLEVLMGILRALDKDIAQRTAKEIAEILE